MDKKNIALVALAIMLLVSGYFIFDFQSKLNMLTEEHGQTTFDLEVIQDDHESLETDYADIETQLAEKSQAYDSLSLSYQNLQKTSTDKIDKLESEQSKNNTELRKLRDLLCDDQIGMVYGDILNSSSRLASWVNTLDDVQRTSFTLRNTLWNNADTKIHVINYLSTDGNVYSMQFLVYYEEFDLKTGTFFIDGQCWLDAP